MPTSVLVILQLSLQRRKAIPVIIINEIVYRPYQKLLVSWNVWLCYPWNFANFCCTASKLGCCV